jgi:5-methyltetrahydropteroyltriglutamate--homocysteine methyltransferase
MIGSYVTGILPRSRDLIEVTRAYDRNKVSKEELEGAFREETKKVVEVQVQAGLSYVTDGMLKWQDLLRPFTENLSGLDVGSLTRWFNSNIFYRKPIILGPIHNAGEIAISMTYIELLPKEAPWKAILPAPYTFTKLAENRFYKSERELMFTFAEVLNREIRSLTEAGFKYIQLSDPALVYNPLEEEFPKDLLADVKEALRITLKNINVKVCLQTFFGDFTRILPEALEFPVDDLGIDLYETDIKKLKEYTFEKGVALGLIDARSSLMEDENEIADVAREIIEAIYPSKMRDVFICPNCDLEFLPWEIAREKIKAMGRIAKALERSIH